MPTFTVAAADLVETKPWKDKQVPIRALTLKDQNGETILAQLFDLQNLNPQAGQQITGEVENGQWGNKFKPERQGGGGRPGRSPEENARIMRQHSQEMALRYCAAKGKTDFSLDDLKALIEWFDADAKAATV